MDTLRIRVEEAVGDVEYMNRAIEDVARALCNPDATTGRVPGEPSEADARSVIERLRELRFRRNQLEDRLIALIREYEPQPPPFWEQ